jgi:hypothetical protein
MVVSLVKAIVYPFLLMINVVTFILILYIVIYGVHHQFLLLMVIATTLFLSMTVLDLVGCLL